MKLFDVYPLYNIEIEKGVGCYTYDENGQEYLDFYGGHAVIAIGHSHPHYVKRITEQLGKLVFYSNSVQNKFQGQLADKLGMLSGYDDYELFLVNSGAEANENALKLASFHNNRRKVIAFKKSFHGRTSAAVRVTDNPKIVAPLNEGLEVEFLPLNDIQLLESKLQVEDVCAVIIEGIQGIGGIIVPETEFLRQMDQICKKTGTLLILDEIQSGYGRSGKFFAHQYAGIRPDLITVAKGMGNGYPVGGLLISPNIKASWGLLGTTFGGNHLACVAALAVLEVMEQEKLIENACIIGDFLIAELKSISGIKEVRGKGLMIGLEFDFPVKVLRERLLFDEKVFTGATGTHTIRLLPPLCLSKEEAEIFLHRLKKVLENS